MNAIAFLADTMTSQPATTPDNAPVWFQIFRSPILLVVIVMGIFLLMSSRSRSKTEKERQSMLNQLKRNDEVKTIGGVIGKVVEAREDRVLLKVDENSNTKIWFAHSAIHQVLESDKAEK